MGKVLKNFEIHKLTGEPVMVEVKPESGELEAMTCKEVLLRTLENYTGDAGKRFKVYKTGLKVAEMKDEVNLEGDEFDVLMKAVEENKAGFFDYIIGQVENALEILQLEEKNQT